MKHELETENERMGHRINTWNHETMSKDVWCPWYKERKVNDGKLSSTEISRIGQFKIKFWDYRTRIIVNK